MVARLPSIWSFIYSALSAPYFFSCAKMESFVRETDARAISYAANRAFNTNMTRIMIILM